MKKFKNQILLSAGSVLLASVTLTGCSTDDSFDASTTTNNKQTEIGFGAYVSQASTRAAVTDANSLGRESDRDNKSMIGVFAMLTEGKKYDASLTDGATVSAFTPNFMDNIGLFIDHGLSYTSNYAWHCSAVRYWPQDPNQYVSFTAYAPYAEGTKLYTKTADGFTEGGDAASYLKVNVPADKMQQSDLLYTDITKTSNMRYYSTDGGATYTKDGGTFLSNYPEEGKYGMPGPKVLLTLKHATARIAIDISSTKFKDESSTWEDYKIPQQFTADATDTKYEFTNTRIIINKVMFVGDNTSAESANPTGAFYGAGYLNLSTSTTSNPLWVANTADNKIVCSWDNTGDNPETVRGEGYFLNKPKKWLPNRGSYLYDTDATSIPGNVICGWRKGAESSSLHSVTEIGNATDGYLFIIPQDFTGETNKLYCFVDYTIKYMDNGDEQHLKSYVPISQNFEAGKAYRICLDINPGKAIQFAVNFEDWPNEIDVK